MELLDIIQKRFSCRKFDNRPVEQEKLDSLLKAAISAPTAKNLQPFHIWVIRSEDAIKKVNETTPCGFGAKLMLVIGGDKKDAFVRPFDGRNFEDVDACIVATHILLETEALGLGTTWVGFFDEPKLKELFPEMRDYDLIAIFPIGYPAAEPSPMHFTRKSKEELVSEL